MSKPVYGNALAVHDPDPRELDRIERALAGRWTVTRPATGWLLAVAAINDMCEPIIATAKSGESVVFVEDSNGTCDPEPIVGARVNPHGDVTAFAFGRNGVRAVRSCAGLVPVYIARQGERVAIATLITPLVDHVLETVVIDRLGLTAWLTGLAFFPDNRTWLADATVLPAGHMADMTAPGTSTTCHQYWDPRPAIVDSLTPQSRAEHISSLRSAVLSSLERSLDRNGRNLLTLSGGADSSLLAYLIAGRFQSGLSTLSFRSTAPGQAKIESELIGAFVAAHPPRQRWVFESGFAQRLALIEQAPAVPFPAPHPALHLLERLAQETPIAVYLGGEFADHVAGGGHHAPDWFEQTSLGALGSAALARHLPTGARDIARWIKRRVIRRTPPPSTTACGPPFLPAHMQEEFVEWRERRDRRLSEDRAPWRHLAARMEVEDGVTAMNWEWSCAAGILRAMPFLSRATIENVYRCHASELIGPGVKRLVRQGFAGDAPREHLWREKYRGSDGVRDDIAVSPSDQARAELDLMSGPYRGMEGLLIAMLNRLIRPALAQKWY